MEIAKLTAEPRKTGGTRAAKRIRRQGKVPGIIYGHGLAPEPVTVDRKELETAIEHGAQVINLGLPNASHSVLVKDLQFDSVGLLPTHVDFIRVDLNERVTVSVPLEFRGSPIGIQEGGVFVEQIVDLEV